MNEDIKVKGLLLLNNEFNLLIDKVLILLSSDLTLAELLSSNTDFLGLGERSNGGGGEKRKTKMSLLASDTGIKGRQAVVHLGGDVGLAFLDSGVIGAGRGSTGVHGSSVGIELSTNGVGPISDGLGNDSNLLSLLRGESKPVGHLSGELLLSGKSVGSVEERRRGSNDDTVCTKSLNRLLNNGNGFLVVGLPDITSINDTDGEGLTGSKGTDNSVELLRSTNQVNVDSRDGFNAGEDINIVNDIAEVGGKGDGWDGRSLGSKEVIGGLESILGLLGQVQDKDRLIDLNSLGSSLLELLQQINIDGEKVVQKRDGVDSLTTVRLPKVEERDWADENWASDDTLGLSLKEFDNRLGVGREAEGLVVLEGRTDVVVVRVKPFDHLL